MESLTPLAARLKLRKRHILEWETLALTQQQVWGLIKEETAQKMALTGEAKKACLALKTNQSRRLLNLMERHQQECQHMKASHQQEETDLEQAINSHK